jgi:hypothetical protein
MPDPPIWRARRSGVARPEVGQLLDHGSNSFMSTIGQSWFNVMYWKVGNIVQVLRLRSKETIGNH